MKNLMLQKQQGIGLIEVLITMVVVALGLMSLAFFQSIVMKESASNKIRSEALALAEQKLGEFRNNAEKRDLENRIDGSDNIDGTNARFTRKWTITTVTAFLTGAPHRRKISVKVSWSDEESVTLTGEIAWIDPVKSALYALQ